MPDTLQVRHAAAGGMPVDRVLDENAAARQAAAWVIPGLMNKGIMKRENETYFPSPAVS